MQSLFERALGFLSRVRSYIRKVGTAYRCITGMVLLIEESSEVFFKIKQIVTLMYGYNDAVDLPALSRVASLSSSLFVH